MALFHIGKKKEEEKQGSACCCGSGVKGEEAAGCCAATNDSAACCCGAPVDGICCVKVLGAGCKSCHEQYENAKAAVKALGLNIEVEYITDMEKVMGYGVMSMPAIVVNEKVVSMGKVLKAADVENLLRKLGGLYAAGRLYLRPQFLPQPDCGSTRTPPSSTTATTVWWPTWTKPATPCSGQWNNSNKKSNRKTNTAPGFLQRNPGVAAVNSGI